MTAADISFTIDWTRLGLFLGAAQAIDIAVVAVVLWLRRKR